MLNFIGKLENYFVFTNVFYASSAPLYFVRLWGLGLGSGLRAGRACGAGGGASILGSDR